MTSCKTVVRVEEYEQHIPLMLATQPLGTIHSVFQNGVNIRMGEHLFFIGTTKNGQLPFGIHVSPYAIQEVLESIHEKSVVAWDSVRQQLVVDDGVLIIGLAQATSFNWQIPKHDVSKTLLSDNLALLISSLLTGPRVTGLEIEIAGFLEAYIEATDASGKTESHLRSLLRAVHSEDKEDIESVLRYFLGRGQGLTPSGDDHLIGVLAIHAATGLLSSTFIGVLKGLVKDEKLTTDIAREYLLYAVNGSFSSTVVELASTLTQESDVYMLKPLLSELLDMGHSSGIDTVFGMLLGLLALRRKLE